MGTGEENSQGNEYAAPFNHQGTGTVNTLVLALLSMIADLKQNVIFAMEEPEIAIPPHTQRRIVDQVKAIASQSIFTSHSPYVLDEFSPSSLMVLRRNDGELTSIPATLPPAVKAKFYRSELRTRFCECLLARKILIAEGRTEYDSLPIAARRLNKLDSSRFKTLESLGIAVLDAQGEDQIAPLAGYFKSMGKSVFAFYDKQEAAKGKAISDAVDLAFESPEKSFEMLLSKHVPIDALVCYADSIIEDGDWPRNMDSEQPDGDTDDVTLRKTIKKLLGNKKADGFAAMLLDDCEIDEMPDFIVQPMDDLKEFCLPDVDEADENEESSEPE